MLGIAWNYSVDKGLERFEPAPDRFEKRRALQ